jgi:hypothetical protein
MLLRMLVNKRVAVIDWPGTVARAFTRKGAYSVLLGACCLTAFAQQSAPSSPFVAEAKKDYAVVKNNLLKAADTMPEEGYSFQATPDVRPFGGLVAHVAEVQSWACGTLLGSPPGKRPQNGAWVADSHGPLLADTEMAATGPLRASKPAEPGKTKAEVVAALKASFDTCDTAYDSVTEANQLQIAGTGLLKRSRLAVLLLNNEHDNETYGTVSVYLRRKGIVPPSSDGANKR